MLPFVTGMWNDKTKTAMEMLYRVYVSTETTRSTSPSLSFGKKFFSIQTIILIFNVKVKNVNKLH